MQRDTLKERFFTALISGDRFATRAILEETIEADCPPRQILNRLFWPVLDHIHTLYRSDQLSNISYNYAIRLLRMLTDQMQLRLDMADRRGRKVLLVCGPEEPEELSAQMAADVLEADGYDVYFAGGRIANDEIVAQIGDMQADVLCVFGAAASTVPFTRQLIDRLREIGVCPKLQIAVGGGVFNRAEGLAEEIGADLWARDPQELVDLLAQEPSRRMQDDQRTVGRKRRPSKQSEAA